jgi:hypothetical protein
MAPEAYSLDAAVAAWLAGSSGPVVGETAAKAYNRFQKCGITAARRLFWSASYEKAASHPTSR